MIKISTKTKIFAFTGLLLSLVLVSTTVLATHSGIDATNVPLDSELIANADLPPVEGSDYVVLDQKPVDQPKIDHPYARQKRGDLGDRAFAGESQAGHVHLGLGFIIGKRSGPQAHIDDR